MSRKRHNRRGLPKGKMRGMHIRTKDPKVAVTRERTVILCPFCYTPHPLIPGVEAHCGTVLKVEAVQKLYQGVAGIICVRCGKGGGVLVSYRGAFTHAHNCAPDKTLVENIPKFSAWAKWLYYWPSWMLWLKRILIPVIGKPAQLKEILSTGEETGVVLGYYFYKSDKASYGRR